MKEEQYKKIQYIVNYPTSFDATKKNAIIIFLAGAGSRGGNIELLRTNPYFVETRKINLDAVTIAPQCYADTWFEIFEQLIELVDYVRKLSWADERRVYLVGASMGGYAVWQLAMTKPNWFAAIVPICGGGMYWNAGRLKKTKIWAFHGVNDTVVSCEETKKMVESINQAGGDAKITLFENIGHDSWMKVYGDHKVFDWLLDQKLTLYAEEKNKYDTTKQYG